MEEERVNAEKMQEIDTVMVVDDDDTWCFVTKKILQKAGVGKNIMTAFNGLEALRKLKGMVGAGEKMPSVIFLDLKMPIMNGFEFLEEVTHAPELDLKETRIFVCTSSLLSSDMDKANSYPISGYVSKPLTQENLKSILQQE